MKAEEEDDWKGRNQDRSLDDLDSAVRAVELAIRRQVIRPYIDAGAVAVPRDENSFFCRRVEGRITWTGSEGRRGWRGGDVSVVIT